MVAQGAHASMEWLKTWAFSDQMFTEAEAKWLRGDYAKVCVGVGSEEDLLRIHNEALASGLESFIVTDHGKTEFHGQHTRTCLAIGPDYTGKIDCITGGLKLL